MKPFSAALFVSLFREALLPMHADRQHIQAITLSPDAWDACRTYLEASSVGKVLPDGRMFICGIPLLVRAEQEQEPAFDSIRRHGPGPW